MDRVFDPLYRVSDQDMVPDRDLEWGPLGDDPDVDLDRDQYRVPGPDVGPDCARDHTHRPALDRGWGTDQLSDRIPSTPTMSTAGFIHLLRLCRRRARRPLCSSPGIANGNRTSKWRRALSPNQTRISTTPGCGTRNKTLALTPGNTRTRTGPVFRSGSWTRTQTLRTPSAGLRDSTARPRSGSSFVPKFGPRTGHAAEVTKPLLGP